VPSVVFSNATPKENLDVCPYDTSDSIENQFYSRCSIKHRHAANSHACVSIVSLVENRQSGRLSKVKTLLAEISRQEESRKK
jgi:hypothetical protein